MQFFCERSGPKVNSCYQGEEQQVVRGRIIQNSTPHITYPQNMKFVGSVGSVGRGDKRKLTKAKSNREQIKYRRRW